MLSIQHVSLGSLTTPAAGPTTPSDLGVTGIDAEHPARIFKVGNLSSSLPFLACRAPRGPGVRTRRGGRAQNRREPARARLPAVVVRGCRGAALAQRLASVFLADGSLWRVDPRRVGCKRPFPGTYALLCASPSAAPPVGPGAQGTPNSAAGFLGLASRVRYVSPIGRVSPRFWAWPFSPFAKSRYHGLFRGAFSQRHGAHGPAPAAASQAADRAFPPGPAHSHGKQDRARASRDETPGEDTR